MRCPFCRTENRDDRDTCYSCEKDLSTLRVVVNKAKSHFNLGLEYAERGRNEEAIAELHHALDLDASHINSHVVLGTLYAKMGELAKAEEHWKQALALDPRLEKAHLYLEKIQIAQHELPIISRQHTALWVLGVVLSLVLILLIYKSLPNSSVRRYREALDAYRNHQHSKVLDIVAEEKSLKPENPYYLNMLDIETLILEREKLSLQSIEQDVNAGKYEEARKRLVEFLEWQPTSVTLNRAVELGHQIDTLHQERLLADASRQIEEGALLEAHQTLQNLLQRSPSEERMRQVLDAQLRIREAARNRVTDALAAFKANEMTQTAAQSALDLCRSVGPAAKESDEGRAHGEFLEQADRRIVEIATERLQADRNKRIEKVLKNFEENRITAMTCFEELHALKKEFPNDDRITSLTARQAVVTEERLTEEFQEALEAGRFDTASATFEQLRRLLEAATPERAQEALAAFQKDLEDHRPLPRDPQAIDDMRAAYKEKDYTRTVELSKTVLRMTDLEADDLAALKTIARKANEQMALRNLEWMLDRAARYKNLSIEVADAEKTVAEAPQVAQYFPKSDYPNSQDNLLFFTACAYKILNRNEEALEKIEQLLKEYPRSDVRTAANALAQTLREALAAPDAPQEPEN
jgi:tetratricopeptide (TPR) repeat protein